MYEDLKKQLSETTEIKTFPDYTNIPVITKWPVHKHGPEAIAAIKTLEAQLTTANARIDELENMSSSQELLQFEVMNDGEVRLFKTLPKFMKSR